MMALDLSESFVSVVFISFVVGADGLKSACNFGKPIAVQ